MAMHGALFGIGLRMRISPGTSTNVTGPRYAAGVEPGVKKASGGGAGPPPPLPPGLPCTAPSLPLPFAGRACISPTHGRRLRTNVDCAAWVVDRPKGTKTRPRNFGVASRIDAQRPPWHVRTCLDITPEAAITCDSRLDATRRTCRRCGNAFVICAVPHLTPTACSTCRHSMHVF